MNCLSKFSFKYNLVRGKGIKPRNFFCKGSVLYINEIKIRVHTANLAFSSFTIIMPQKLGSKRYISREIENRALPENLYS